MDDINFGTALVSDINFGTALVSGAVAGLSVDMTLFPLDTLKTRLQSAQGFAKAGSFRGVYSGIASAAIGSMPTAAAFFCTYELVKKMTGDNRFSPSIAASFGEVAACVIRVPVEVVKQRAQTKRTSSLTQFSATLRSEGPSGFYRGYWSTVLREVPFSFIQFPLWEAFKKYLAKDGEASPQQSAICGALSGCIAAGLTNPLDVAKTRIMLADTGSSLSKGSIVYALEVAYKEKGIHGLTAGIAPRMAWMTIGGFIFLGSYDFVKDQLTKRSIL